MDKRQIQLVSMLNDMYYSQSDDYKSRYRDNYFELLQHIIAPRAYISGEELAAEVNARAEFFARRGNQEAKED